VVEGTGKVTRRNVESPVMADGKALVASGIAAGETVVTNGQYRLSDNAHVTIKTPAQPETVASALPTPCCRSHRCHRSIFRLSRVSAALPGADPATMASTVAQPLESTP
jgi:hypothetical protein